MTSRDTDDGLVLRVMTWNVRDLLGMPIVGGSSNMQRNNLAALWRMAG